MPQARARVYIWAFLPGLPGAQVFGDGIRRAHGGTDQVPLTSVLCSGPRGIRWPGAAGGVGL
jgi:hypothetical protein